MTLEMNVGRPPEPGPQFRIAPRRPPSQPPTRSWTSRFDVKASPYLYVAPFFLLFGVFGLYPLTYTAWVSLHDWRLTGSGEQPFVGMDNYAKLLADSDFWNAVTNTLGMFAIGTVPQLLLALWIAALLNRKLRSRTLLRMSVLTPNITSTAAVAIVFGQIFSKDFGMVNWLLQVIGLDPVNWQSNRLGAWIAVATMVDWRWTGYNALIFLAAMQAIPRNLYESAAMDGANRRRQFWSITVPMLKPTLVFCVIISTIGGLQLFTEPVLFSGSLLGGAGRETQTISMYMFESAFNNFNFGYGSAAAWLLFLLIIVIALANAIVLRRIGDADRQDR